MFTFAIETAWTIDQWLKAKVGRLYTILLTTTLVAGMSATIRAAVLELKTSGNVLVIGLTVGVYAVLLINQAAQLHEYRQTARAHRAARKEKRQARKAERNAG